jgi:hypothetical protein
VAFLGSVDLASSPTILTVTVLEVQGNQIRLGIEAPREPPVAVVVRNLIG